MAVQFIDSFQHYPDILDKWDSESGSGQTSNIDFTFGRFVNGSLKLDDLVFGNWVQKNLDTPVNELVGGFAYYASGAAQVGISFINDSASAHVTMDLDSSDGSIKLRRGGIGGTVLATSALGVIQNDVWQFVEFKALINDTTGTVEARVNGVSVVSAIAQDTQTSASDLILNFRIVAEGVNIGRDAWVTDLYFLDTTGAAPYNDFLGDVKVSVLRPEANGGTNDFTPEGAAANWQAVDDASMDSDATFVKAGTLNARDEYDIQTFAGIGVTVGTIFSVQVCNAAKKTDAGSIKYKDNLTVGGTVYQSAEVTAQAVTYKISTEVHQINPDTSLAWLEAEVEASLPGFTLTTKVI